MTLPHLDVWSWPPGGYRVVFVGPERFEVLGHFATLAEAGAAKRAAEALSATLDRRVE